MGCALLALLFGSPRVALVALWLLRPGWVGQAFELALLPLIGFFFLPWTTLAFAFSMNSLGATGEMTELGWVITLVAVLLDLGVTGGGLRSRRSSED